MLTLALEISRSLILDFLLIVDCRMTIGRRSAARAASNRKSRINNQQRFTNQRSINQRSAARSGFPWRLRRSNLDAAGEAASRGGGQSGAHPPGVVPHP